jgi:hypothetical protein
MIGPTVAMNVLERRREDMRGFWKYVFSLGIIDMRWRDRLEGPATGATGSVIVASSELLDAAAQ